MFMRVAIVGVGGVGQVLAKELCRDRRITSLLLLDKSKEQERTLTRLGKRVEAQFQVIDASKRVAVEHAIQGCDVVANTSLATYNLTIMQAALGAHADYLDVAATGPRRPGGLPGILEQLQLHDSFRDAGRKALLSMGLDPGISNVMAREATDRLDAVDTIRIRSGGTVRIRDGGFFPKFVPLYSREAFFSDMRIRPTVWQNGRLVEYEPLSEGEEYEFPEPVGNQTTFLLAHEEVKTLPLYLGKPVRHVDFKYAVNPDLAHALHALESLGLLAEGRKLEIDRRRISFRAAFESAFPEPALVAHRLEGTKCLSVEVEGIREGVRKLIREDVVFPHREAARRRRTTAVYYLTGVAAAIGVGLMESETFPSSGVYPAECLDPVRVFSEWEARGLPIERSERSILG